MKTRRFSFLITGGSLGKVVLFCATSSSSNPPASSGSATASAWDLDRDAWRVFRADHARLRTPNGPRFGSRKLPGGGGVDAFLAARFKGSSRADEWPCRGEVVLHLPAAEVAPFAHDAIVEELGPGTCRIVAGSWSWAGLVAMLGRYSANLEVVGPAELREEFARTAVRYARAADTPPPQPREP